MKRSLYAAGPLGLASFVVGVGWWALAPRFLPGIYLVLIVLGALLCAAGLWSVRQNLFDRSSGKRARYGAGFLVTSVVGLLILLLVNFISARYHERWDLTKYKSFSLHPATLRVLSDVDQDIEVFGFLPERNRAETRAVKQLFDLYAFHQRRIQVTITDPNQRPDLLQELGVGSSGTTVVRCGDRVTFFPGYDEAKLTAALLEVQRDSPKVIYWMIGHGERELDRAGGEGYRRLEGDLIKSFYLLRTLALAPGEAVPEDAALVIMADPQQALAAAHVQALNAYLETGGRVLLLADQTPGAEEQQHPAAAFADHWGLRIQAGAMIDARENKVALYPEHTQVLAGGFGRHAAVEGLRGKNALLFGAKSLEFFQQMRDQQIFHHVFLRGPKGSYLEPDREKVLSFSGADASLVSRWQDSPPVLGLAAFRAWAARPGSADFGREARLVVFGDADFLKDEFYDSVANSEMAANVIRWLTGDELLIQRAGEKLTAKTAMKIDPDQRSLVRMFVIIQALAVFLIGWLVWFLRRAK